MAKEIVENICQKAKQAIAQGKNEEAQNFFRQALGLAPEDPQVHYGMGTVCFLLRDLPRAAYHFTEVTRLDPQNAGGFINLGAVYNQMEQMDNAIPVLVRGIQLDKNRYEGHYNLGLIYQRKMKFDLALQAFREAMRANPRLPEACFKIATIYVEKRQFGLAINHFRKALEIRPNWEKAKAGLEQAEKAQAKIGTHLTPTSPPDQRDAEVPTALGQVAAPAPALDPNRFIDPLIHEDLLRALHTATADSEKHGRGFLKTLEEEVDPVLKKLSTILVAPDSSPVSLDTCMTKFEAAVEEMRALQKSLETSMNRVRVIGEELLKK